MSQPLRVELSILPSKSRKHISELRVGDAVDFWRVERVVFHKLLRLRAEMRVPGDAWLQWEVYAENWGSRLVQTTLFKPKGLAGLFYWHLLYPVHRWIFRDMALAIIKDAERISLPPHEL